MYFKGTIIITDPCYLITDDCEEKSGMDWLDYVNTHCKCLTHETGPGDVSGEVINTDTGGLLGSWCCDAGMFGVFDLNSLLNMPYYDDDVISKNWCCTKIPNFDGECEIEMSVPPDGMWGPEYKIVGRGNINFEVVIYGF